MPNILYFRCTSSQCTMAANSSPSPMNTADPSINDNINDELDIFSSRCQILSSSVHKNVLAKSYTSVRWRIFLFHCLGILSFGILYLLCYWKPEWKVYMCCSKCFLVDGTHLLLKVS